MQLNGYIVLEIHSEKSRRRMSHPKPPHTADGHIQVKFKNTTEGGY